MARTFLEALGHAACIPTYITGSTPKRNTLYLISPATGLALGGHRQMSNGLERTCVRIIRVAACTPQAQAGYCSGGILEVGIIGGARGGWIPFSTIYHTFSSGTSSFHIIRVVLVVQQNTTGKHAHFYHCYHPTA